MLLLLETVACLACWSLTSSRPSAIPPPSCPRGLPRAPSSAVAPKPGARSDGLRSSRPLSLGKNWIRPEEFAGRLGVSPAYWSRVEREQKTPPRGDLVERVAAILEAKPDDIFYKAGRLPPDLRGDIKAVVTLYGRSRVTAKSKVQTVIP